VAAGTRDGPLDSQQREVVALVVCSVVDGVAVTARMTTAAGGQKSISPPSTGRVIHCPS
jgi:hypothetical protein